VKRNLAHIIDLVLNENIKEPNYAFVIVICDVKGEMIGGEARVLSNVGDLGCFQILVDAAEQIKQQTQTEGSA
jgi:hypothetical protein